MPFIATNPANGKVLAEYPAFSAAEVESALAEAQSGYETWSAMSFADRATLMVRAAELLESEIPVVAELMTSEMGKTFAAAKGEAAKCAMSMRYYAEHAEELLTEQIIKTSGSRSGVRYEPVGVIFAVMPWNFPLWQVIRMAAPTIMAGNAVAFKHAPNVPGCALYMHDLFIRSGFPKGVLRNMFVEVEQVADIIADDRIVGVSLTGSERAGRSIASVAGQNLKKVLLELGGSDPFIVASSADMDHTIPLAVTARVQNNGQACIASKRYIVVQERAEEFIEKFTAAMAAVPVGDPLSPETVVGPLVNKSQLDILTRQVNESVAKGAKILTGGAPLGGEGFYFPPTVLVDTAMDSPANCEELFGPVAVIHVVKDLDEAITLANNIPWGLGGSIWATDDAEIEKAINGIDAGMVFANAVVVSMPELPFGGTKQSGFGRELTAFGMREFTNQKSYFVA
ncbi:MAG: NAD-dependent succinate-semialdehyde dehydrogenase [Actinomycetota bacterium]